MKSQEKMKELFVEMCKQIVPFKGKFICLLENMEYDDDFNHITNDESYPLLKEKMKNLLELVNSDHTLLNKDVEDDLWPLI